MRKGLAYVELAEKCRQLASAVTDPLHKKQLQNMARSWETVAAERPNRRSQSARASRSDASVSELQCFREPWVPNANEADSRRPRRTPHLIQ